MSRRKIQAPMSCTVVAVTVGAGDRVRAGQAVMVVEAMKMEHELTAPASGRIVTLDARPGEVVLEGDLLMTLQCEQADEGRTEEPMADAVVSPPSQRDDLNEFLARVELTRDSARPEAVAKRHAQGLRTVRENVEDLCDPGTFLEYGALAIAAQRSRRTLDDLIRNTPADGMVTGIGSVNAAIFDERRTRCVVLAYDATVLAGTQGMRNHQKTDRLIGIALQERRPVVLFAEGGGGRPGDTDMPIVAGLHVTTFAGFARLSGQVPLIGIVTGRCFAGNAALLGCCDVVIATRRSNIGMGGPAMVEGAGLGLFQPEEIGPADVQSANGVIDVLVDDEREAVATARQYLSYFQGELAGWNVADQAVLRTLLPTQRARSYDMRRIMRAIVDTDSMLELRAGFGVGILTALARLQGRPIGLMASNPTHLGGAIDAPAADKAARFMRLCNAHGIALVSLIDTPGFMVGPDAEEQAQVRHVSRMFVAAAHLRVPFLAVVVRKAYGLGAMAMTAGGFHSPLLTASWPSGEFGAMGIEGSVRLGFRKDLEARAEGGPRDELFRELVDQQYAKGKALNMATTLEIDAVIDPAQTRTWLSQGLASARTVEMTTYGVDPW